MRIQPLDLIIVSLLLAANIADAKDKQREKHMDHQAMIEMYQKLATPGEPHKLFTSLTGSWTTKTKEWMELGKPPMESEGTVDMLMLLDGRYLQQEYHGIMMGAAIYGHLDQCLR